MKKGMTATGEETTFLIGKTKWLIKECDNGNEQYSLRYFVYKDGKLATELCAGDEYETESGACYAIMSEYKTENIAARAEILIF